jgi:tRNA pseudouridine55 synthase
MMPKTYHAGLRLGARSDTDDADGNVIPVEAAQPPAAGIVAETLATYVGDIEQTPPAFSAAKVKGRRAYELARRGESVTLEARPVRIHGISIVSYCYPTLEIEVRCSKGTYIRSLARDVGDRLGCGALVQTLRRTCVGSFNVEHALPLDSSAQTLRDGLHPIAGATVGLCRVEAGPEAVRDLSQGRGVLPAALRPEPASNEELCAAFGFDGTLIAVLTWNQDRGRWMPHKVMIM